MKYFILIFLFKISLLYSDDNLKVIFKNESFLDIINHKNFTLKKGEHKLDAVFTLNDNFLKLFQNQFVSLNYIKNENLIKSYKSDNNEFIFKIKNNNFDHPSISIKNNNTLFVSPNSLETYIQIKNRVTKDKKFVSNNIIYHLSKLFNGSFTIGLNDGFKKQDYIKINGFKSNDYGFFIEFEDINTKYFHSNADIINVKYKLNGKNLVKSFNKDEFSQLYFDYNTERSLKMIFHKDLIVNQSELFDPIESFSIKEVIIFTEVDTFNSNLKMNVNSIFIEDDVKLLNFKQFFLGDYKLISIKMDQLIGLSDIEIIDEYNLIDLFTVQQNPNNKLFYTYGDLEFYNGTSVIQNHNFFDKDFIENLNNISSISFLNKRVYLLDNFEEIIFQKRKQLKFNFNLIKDTHFSQVLSFIYDKDSLMKFSKLDFINSKYKIHDKNIHSNKNLKNLNYLIFLLFSIIAFYLIKFYKDKVLFFGLFILVCEVISASYFKEFLWGVSFLSSFLILYGLYLKYKNKLLENHHIFFDSPKYKFLFLFIFSLIFIVSYSNKILGSFIINYFANFILIYLFIYQKNLKTKDFSN